VLERIEPFLRQLQELAPADLQVMRLHDRIVDRSARGLADVLLER
jgi:hypothetical protein